MRAVHLVLLGVVTGCGAPGVRAAGSAGTLRVLERNGFAGGLRVFA